MPRLLGLAGRSVYQRTGGSSGFAPDWQSTKETINSPFLLKVKQIVAIATWFARQFCTRERMPMRTFGSARRGSQAGHSPRCTVSFLNGERDALGIRSRILVERRVWGLLGTLEARSRTNSLARTEASWLSTAEDQRLAKHSRKLRHASQAGRRRFESGRPLLNILAEWLPVPAADSACGNASHSRAQSFAAFERAAT